VLIFTVAPAGAEAGWSAQRKPPGPERGGASVSGRAARPRVRRVMSLGQALKVQLRIKLRGADAGVAQQFVHGAQFASALQ
jgi:hypothetical protein